MPSVVDICNLALNRLGASNITALTENSEVARACNLIYEPIRDSELRAHLWSFAVKRAQLAASATAPAFGPITSFPLPTDFLRLLPPDVDLNYNTLDWKIEGKEILTDETSVLNIRYISKVEDTSKFDALFVQALTASLAMNLSEKITQSNTKIQLIAEEYKRIIREARRANAFESLSAEMPEDTWITVRT